MDGFEKKLNIAQNIEVFSVVNLPSSNTGSEEISSFKLEYTFFDYFIQFDAVFVFLGRESNIFLGHML